LKGLVDYAYGVFNEIATLHCTLADESGPRQSIEREYTLYTD
jgi:hypothetical protein